MSSFRILYRHFLYGFFDSDLVARGGDPRAMMIMIGLLFATPGLLISFYMAPVEGKINTTPVVAVFLNLSLILVGLVAVIEWDALFPDATDFMVLRPLPVPTATVLLAKLAALATLLATFTFMVNVLSSAFLPVWGAPLHSGLNVVIRMVGAQALAATAASTWAFLGVLVLQGALLALGGARALRRLGLHLQFGLMVIFLTGLALLPNLFSQATVTLLLQNRFALWLPPLWWVGLDKLIGGTAPPGGLWRILGERGACALGVTAGLALLLYGCGFWRQMRQALALAPASSTARRRGRGFWIGPVRERAVYRFGMTTLARSRRHRVYLSLAVGVGLAVVVEQAVSALWLPSARHAAGMRAAALSAPLVLMYFLLAGLRYVFSIPIEPPSNWIFRLPETPWQPERLDAVRKIMYVRGLVPALAAAVYLDIHLFPPRWAAFLSAGALALGCLLVELLLFRFQKVPFTCTFLPDESSFGKLGLVALFLIGLNLFAFQTAAFALRAGRRPAPIVVATLAVAAIAVALAWGRRARLRAGIRCFFEDEPEATIQTLFAQD